MKVPTLIIVMVQFGSLPSGRKDTMTAQYSFQPINVPITICEASKN